MRGSSSQSSKEKTPKPTYNLPRTAEVRTCEWPSDDFLRSTGIYEDFYELAKNAGLTDFLRDPHEQYLLLTNTIVQNFYYYPRESPPSVEFHLYDVVKKMSLYDFCRVCLIPFEGSVEEPHRDDMEGFIDTIAVGKRGKFPMQESLAYIFLFYVTLQYLLVDA